MPKTGAVRLALEQHGGTSARAVEEIFGVVVTRSAVAWTTFLRILTDHRVPHLTPRHIQGLRQILKAEQDSG